MSVGIKDTGWLDDQQINEHEPDYIATFQLLDEVISVCRTKGVSEDNIANALMNLHARALAAMTPNDEQIAQLATMFAKCVTDLRDRSPEAYSIVQL